MKLYSSPTKLNRSISQNVAGTPQTPIGTPSVQNRVNGFLTPTTPASQIQTPGGSLRNATNDKQTAGGPPTSGLYSTPKQRRALHAAASVNTGNNTPKTSLLGTPVNGIQNQSINTPSNQFNTSIDELGNRYIQTNNINWKVSYILLLSIRLSNNINSNLFISVLAMKEVHG